MCYTGKDKSKTAAQYEHCDEILKEKTAHLGIHATREDIIHSFDNAKGTNGSNAVSSASLPLVVVAFIVAALVRISVGSSTVAMTMAAGIIAAMPGISELSPLYLACVTAAIAGGSTVCSHFNDSGFWLVKSLVGMDEKTTLKTWTIMETLVGGVGFLVALVISFFA